MDAAFERTGICSPRVLQRTTPLQRPDFLRSYLFDRSGGAVPIADGDGVIPAGTTCPSPMGKEL